MSTKLNAEEMAAKRFPREVIGNKQAVYAAAIRKVAQPIAEERDELLEVVKLFLKEYKDVELHTPIAYYKVVDAAEKVIAKYPKG